MISDIDYIKEINIKNHLYPPTEKSEEAFTLRIGESLADMSNNQSIGIIRNTVYSYYLSGLIGDMPRAIV